MHVPRNFRYMQNNISMHVYFSMFIDYKAINYRTYGDNLKSFEIYCLFFGKCLIKWGYEYA